MQRNYFTAQLLKSVVLLGITACLCYVLPQLGDLNAVFAATLLLTFLVWAVNSYWRIIGVTAKTLTFDPKGWIAVILSWRAMTYAVILGLAFASSLCFIIHVPSLNTIGFAFIFLTAPVFEIVYCCFRRIFSGQSVDWMITGRSLACSLWTTPLLMVLFYGLFLHYSGLLPVYETLEAAIEAQPKPWEGANSELLQTVGSWSILWEACRDFGFGQLFQMNEYLSIILISLGYFALFFNVCSLLAFCYIPLREYKRLLLPLTPSLELPRVLPKHVFSLCPIVVVFVSLCSTLFYWQERIEEMIPAPEPVKIALVQIADKYVKEDALLLMEKFDKQLREEYAPLLASPLGKLEGVEDTINRFQQEKEELLNSLSGLKSNTYIELKRLHEQEMFPTIERNVDNYLNWYYSITGEYVRMGNLVAGNFEQHMKDKLNEHLLRHVNVRRPQEVFTRFMAEGDKITVQIAQVERLINQLLEQAADVSEEIARLNEEYNIKRMQGIEAIIAENEAQLPEDRNSVEIVGSYESMNDFTASFQGISIELASITERIKIYTNEMQELLTIFSYHSNEYVSFKSRMVLATGVGIAGLGRGAYIGARITARIAAKPLFKQAAEVVIKQIIKRSTGIGGGAAVGAAVGGTVGSAVPVIGTAAGAVVGGVIGGAAAWFATDYVLIKLEEYISRENFKREIVYGIKQQEAEVMRALDDIFQVNQTTAPQTEH